MKTIFTSLDLEMNQPSGKIISVGAVVGNILSGEILGSMHAFVNPQETLAPFIITLTGIKQEDVDGAGTLLEAYKQLRAMHLSHEAFMNPITWGGGDSETLRAQLPSDIEWIFGRRWIDAKTLFISYRLANGLPIQSGLSKSMAKLGLAFEGQKHNAKDDALNTFRIYCEMLKLLQKSKV